MAALTESAATEDSDWRRELFEEESDSLVRPQ